MRLAVHVAYIVKRRESHKDLVGKIEWKRPVGGHRRRLENNIKLDLQKVRCGGRDWIDLFQDRDRWQAHTKWHPASTFVICKSSLMILITVPWVRPVWAQESSTVTRQSLRMRFSKRSLLASVRDEHGRLGRGKSVLDTLPLLNFAIHLFTLL